MIALCSHLPTRLHSGDNINNDNKVRANHHFANSSEGQKSSALSMILESWLN